MNLIKQAITSKFITWASRSLLGNIALCEIFVGLPTFFAFLHLAYLQGILTIGNVLYIGVSSAFAGLLLGVVIWFIVTRPAINRSKPKRTNKQA